MIRAHSGPGEKHSLGVGPPSSYIYEENTYFLKNTKLIYIKESENGWKIAPKTHSLKIITYTKNFANTFL
jgi:hypothetical protein